MKIFKGYVACDGFVSQNGEKHINPIKAGYLTNPDTLEEVKDYQSYAGVIEDGVILIDIDSKDAGLALLKIIEAKNIPTIVYETNRGYHFYFKSIEGMNNVTGYTTPIGINVDIKVGGKGIAFLKVEGKERKMIYNNGLTELPKMLIPNKSLKPTFGLTEGSGRNSVLFTNMIPLRKSDWSLEEIKELYSVINEFILEEPLSENELNTITRVDSYNGVKTETKKSTKLTYEDLLEIYQQYVAKYRPKKAEDKLYIYTEKGWETGNKVIRGKMMDIHYSLTSNQRLELLARLEDAIPIERYKPNEDFIWVKNGILNVHTLELLPHSPDYFLINRIDVNWNPNAYHSELDVFLNEISDLDGEVRSLLEELIGNCLTPSTDMQKVFILLGERNNGKSTFLKCLTELLGEDNVSALDLKDLDKNFKPSALFGKMANIGSDISEAWIEELSMFRKIATGDRIYVEFKNQDGFNMTPTAKLVFSANTMPPYKDTTRAVLRRLLFVPFTREFGKVYSKDIHKLKRITTPEALEYLLLLGVQGLRRLLKNGTFSYCEASQRALERHEFESNPLYAFVEMMGVSNIVNRSQESVYQHYVSWAVTYGYEPSGLNQFAKKLSMLKGWMREPDSKTGVIYFRDKIIESYTGGMEDSPIYLD